jgi:hypothetical protein
LKSSKKGEKMRNYLIVLFVLMISGGCATVRAKQPLPMATFDGCAYSSTGDGWVSVNGISDPGVFVQQVAAGNAAMNRACADAALYADYGKMYGQYVEDNGQAAADGGGKKITATVEELSRSVEELSKMVVLQAELAGEDKNKDKDKDKDKDNTNSSAESAEEKKLVKPASVSKPTLLNQRPAAEEAAVPVSAATPSVSFAGLIAQLEKAKSNAELAALLRNSATANPTKAGWLNKLAGAMDKSADQYFEKNLEALVKSLKANGG